MLLHLFFNPDSQFLLPKNPQHDTVTTMLHCRDDIGQVMSGAWFPQDMTLDIQAKEFCVSSDQRVLVTKLSCAVFSF